MHSNTYLSRLHRQEILVEVSQCNAIIHDDASVALTVKESVRARVRSQIRRLLAQYKYPPDMQEEAVKLIIEQAEHLAKEDGTSA